MKLVEPRIIDMSRTLVPEPASWEQIRMTLHRPDHAR